MYGSECDCCPSAVRLEVYLARKSVVVVTLMCAVSLRPLLCCDPLSTFPSPQRSGTTSLFKMLGQHPDVASVVWDPSNPLMSEDPER